MSITFQIISEDEPDSGFIMKASVIRLIEAEDGELSIQGLADESSLTVITSMRQSYRI